VAGGVVLEEVVAQMPALRWLAERRIHFEMIALRGGETLVALQRISARCEASGGQAGGTQAVLRCGADMEWLAHGAEVGREVSGLRRGNAAGHGQLLAGETEH